MIYTRKECLGAYKAFDDSAELAVALREIAESVDGPSAYYLRESADHIEALFELARSMDHHLKKTDTTA